MNFPKTVALLLWAFGFSWLFISYGRFLQEHVVLGADLQFWLLWASLLLNIGLVAYLFDTRGKPSGGNPPPAPPQP